MPVDASKSPFEGSAKVTAEMGGKNAVLVMPDADLTQAIEGIVQGAFGSTGQRCTATSRVIVERGMLWASL